MKLRITVIVSQALSLLVCLIDFTFTLDILTLILSSVLLVCLMYSVFDLYRYRINHFSGKCFNMNCPDQSSCPYYSDHIIRQYAHKGELEPFDFSRKCCNNKNHGAK